MASRPVLFPEGRSIRGPFLLGAVIAFAITALTLSAAERVIDLTQYQLNQSPTGFVSTVTGRGEPGHWRVMDERMDGGATAASPSSLQVSRRVIAQLSEDATDEHFPLLILNDQTFGDFSVTTRFKNVRGTVEQMAGVAFRIQDRSNYYVVRASSAGNSFRFYKFVKGERSAPIGPEVPVPPGVWHEMTVQCSGNQINCLLNGKEVIPALTDNTFTVGKLGLWTKSDAVAYFADVRITYVPREPLAQTLVRSMISEYPRLVSLKISAHDPEGKLRVIGSTAEKDLGTAGSAVEEQVIKDGQTFHGKGKQTVTIVMPLRDRNGERIAALHVVMKPFTGQTEQNAVARALPLGKQIERRIQSAKDLFD